MTNPSKKNIESFSSEISEEFSEKIQEENIHHTLDHTPVLSDDMTMFSHTHEHEDHHSQKWKNKMKAFFSYFAGGVSIFALSVFGFISGSPTPEEASQKFSANLTHEESGAKQERFHSKEECISQFIKESTSETKQEDFKKREKFCQEKFKSPDSKNNSTNQNKNIH